MRLMADNLAMEGAADTAFGPVIGALSTYTFPEKFAVYLVGLYRKQDDWYKSIPVTKEQAEAITGKYAYMMGQKWYPDTRAGRIAAAAAIAKNMGGIKPELVFTVLESVNRYLQEHAKQYPDAQILKWFHLGEKKNVGDVAAAAASKAITAPLKVGLKVIGDAGSEINKALPWFVRPSVIVPVGLVGVVAVLYFGLKSGKIQSAAKTGAKLALL